MSKHKNSDLTQFDEETFNKLFEEVKAERGKYAGLAAQIPPWFVEDKRPSDKKQKKQRKRNVVSKMKKILKKRKESKSQTKTDEFYDLSTSRDNSKSSQTSRLSSRHHMSEVDDSDEEMEVAPLSHSRSHSSHKYTVSKSRQLRRQL